MRKAVFAAAALAAACAFGGGLDALAEKIRAAQDDLAELVQATKIGTRWYLSGSQYAQVTNRLSELTRKTMEYSERLEKDAAGRILVHGKISGQSVDMGRGVEVVTYADGWAVTNSVKPRTVETIAERTARLVKAAEAAARRAKEAEAKRRAQLPSGYREVLERRDSAAATTNEVTVTRGN